MKKLTVLVPVYNEAETINTLLERLKKVILINGIEKEIIVINDCSTDGTEHIVNNYIQENSGLGIQLFSLERNTGKGAAIHKGILHSTGDYVIVQDADLEYNPDEFNLLLKPMEDGFADVVYGSRFIGGKPHRILFFWHSIGNNVLTFFSNMFTNLNLTDMETCYKLFRREVIQSVKLNEKRFGFEPEVTAKISKIDGIRIYEVGISYFGRTYKEGKKINWVDGIRAVFCIIRYNVF